MNVSSYAQSQGIRLLEAAVQELGPLFTRQALRPLAERQGLSDGHLSQLLSRLNASGQIAILKRGVYLVRSPLYAGEIHPFAIAAALVQPVAISHWSALAHLALAHRGEPEEQLLCLTSAKSCAARQESGACVWTSSKKTMRSVICW